MRGVFSSRIAWSVPPNRLTAALEARRAAGLEILDLSESNPTAAGLEYPPDLLDVLADPRAMRYEPDARGLAEARRQVSETFGLGDPILLTASTSEAYALLFKLLCDPGDEVLVPRPSYPLFDYLAQLEGVAAKQYPLFYDHGWHVDVAALEAAVTPRTRAIVLVNPNNPTGSYVKQAELAEIIRVAARHDLALMSDEVFAAYPLDPPSDAVRTLHECGAPLAFCLGGLSKYAALPQLKLGWIAASGERAAVAMSRLEWIADTYLSVGSPVQWALAALLKGTEGVREQIRARTRDNLAFLHTAVRESAMQVLPVEGGWYATVRAPHTRSEEEWILHLLDRGVWCQPGHFFDFEAEPYLVLSLLTEPATFREGVSRIVSS
jgi:alanine-synthesizing transaminase